MPASTVPLASHISTGRASIAMPARALPKTRATVTGSRSIGSAHSSAIAHRRPGYGDAEPVR